MSSSEPASSNEESSSSSSASPALVSPRKRKRESEPEVKSLVSLEEQEAPVLSHAQQRKEKRKKNLSASELEKPGKVARTHKTTDPASAPRQNSVWVGNLAFKTTVEQLKGFFSDAGEITRINMPVKTPSGPGKGMRGENRGFAYVDFATKEARDTAITFSERNLDGRKLLIKEGGNFEGRPAPVGGDVNTGGQLSKTSQKILKSQKQPPGPVLFMGNLGFETTIEAITSMLEAHHRVTKDNTVPAEADVMEVDTKKAQNKPRKSKTGLKKVRMGTFEDTGKCKGFAFLDFESPEDATLVLVNHRNHNLNGRNLVLEFASADAVRRGGYRPKLDPKEKEETARPNYTDKSHSDRKPNRYSQDHATKGHHKESRELGAEIKATRERPELSSDAQPTKRPRREAEDFGSKPQRRGPTAGRGGNDTPRSRPKPGAALAQARREQISIVPSQGKKIVF